jgi:phosphohistidine swiveling domain-containing protein
MTSTFPRCGYNPVTGEWNDSLQGDCLWSSVNFREAAPDVMTPSTWSLLWIYIHETDSPRFPGEHPTCGNIAGRPYFNLSLISSLYHTTGLDARTYPALIYGRFDPFQWAADPNRRSDFYDARQTAGATFSATIKGFAGAAGCVEGTVRRIDRMEDGQQVQPGEILVTAVTNIGWTPLFPRLAAIVTDVGAPLSHAAIVAREMGIPAVVGCGNATMLLKTGDRVRVDGGRGTVEILTR